MPANLQFQAIASAHYAKAGFVLRGKGQRKQEFVVPPEFNFGFISQSYLPAGWSVEVLGTGPGYGSHGAVVQYDHLCVNTPQGKFAGWCRNSPCNSFVICPSYQYVRG